MSSLADVLSCAKFLVRKHTLGFSVSPAPSLDANGLSFFLGMLSKSKSYLEYGSGGSTILASRFVETLVSVESDATFSRAVQRAMPRRDGIKLLTVNIGLTREWGYPVFGGLNPNRIKRWQKYPEAPWHFFRNEPPEIILIDGRFRVACALESLLHVNRSTCILVDDYLGRDYGEIERHADLVAMHGRMAEFRKRYDFDIGSCKAAIQEFYSDVR